MRYKILHHRSLPSVTYITLDTIINCAPTGIQAQDLSVLSLLSSVIPIEVWTNEPGHNFVIPQLCQKMENYNKAEMHYTKPEGLCRSTY